MCFFSWIVFCNCLKHLATQLVLHHADAVVCRPDELGWCFTKCSYTLPIYFTHVFTTMQTAAIVRAVFIKSIKGSFTESQKKLWRNFQHMMEEAESADEQYLEHEDVL